MFQISPYKSKTSIRNRSVCCRWKGEEQGKAQGEEGENRKEGKESQDSPHAHSQTGQGGDTVRCRIWFAQVRGI